MTEEFETKLRDVVKSTLGNDAQLSDVKRLSGGASQETWQLTVREGGVSRDLILRRAQDGLLDSRAHGPGLAGEAELMRIAGKSGVPAPRILQVLEPSHGLGSGFLMPKVEGETIPRKILRDERFADVRPHLAARCGSILALVHGILPAACPPLWHADAAVRLERLNRQYMQQNQLRPVFQIALNWLKNNIPSSPKTKTLVHGDFRNGNLIIDEWDICAVLDWELSHVGDPIEDLGWLCVPSWRFGNVDKPAGGFGSVDDLIAGYEQAGGISVERDRLHFWTVFGTLFWGVTCTEFALDFMRGDRSIERAMIGRRVTETEIDLLMLLTSGVFL